MSERMPASLPGQGDTVLVIDDEPGSLGMITAKLEAAGITALVATSGEAGLTLLERILPDLVIVDGIMPGIDGFETCRRIKGDPRTANLPIVFLTGMTESEQVVEAFECGATDYVKKPVNLDELLARVQVHMTQGRAAQASAASLEATGRLMLATDSSGNLLWCTPGAEAALSRCEQGWTPAAGTPAALRTTITRLIARGSAGASATVAATPANPTQGGTLELVLVGRYRQNEVLIRINEMNPRQDVERLAGRLGLTQREAQVLLWVSYGKSSLDISEVLEISPRTVQKHLEHVYTKLGVETRSAAAAVAIRMTEA
jgi:DNA-binding NarL/FixJ family response regulator